MSKEEERGAGAARLATLKVQSGSENPARRCRGCWSLRRIKRKLRKLNGLMRMATVRMRSDAVALCDHAMGTRAGEANVRRYIS